MMIEKQIAELAKLGLSYDESTGLISGTLKKGLSITNVVHKTFVMRDGVAGDMFAAEAEVSTEKMLTYRAAMICRQLVKVGTFEGPFTVRLLGPLSKADMNKLYEAQDFVELLGEAVPRG